MPREERLELSSLPLELRVTILSHLDDPRSLLSAIVSGRCLYDAYRVATSGIKKRVLKNYLGPNGPYCEFLAAAMKTFHGYSHAHTGDIADFLSVYLDFVNYNDMDSPIPVSSYDMSNFPKSTTQELSEIHHYIFLWAERFCERMLIQSRRKIQPLNRSVAPPTESEINRVAKAFYIFWIYHALFHERWVTNSYMDCKSTIGTARKTRTPILTESFLESIPYFQFQIISGHMIWWMIGLMDKVVNPLTADPSAFPACDPPASEDDETAFEIIQYEPDAVLFGQAARLGPVGMYRFIFECDNARQAQVFLEDPYSLELYARREWDYRFDDLMDDREYDPPLRIAFDEGLITRGYYMWWHREGFACYEAIILDDERLEEWGLHYPTYASLIDENPSSGNRDGDCIDENEETAEPFKWRQKKTGRQEKFRHALEEYNKLDRANEDARLGRITSGKS